MLHIHHPSESELMEEASRALRARVAGLPPALETSQQPQLRSAECETRRQRSLQTCHRYRLYEAPRHPRAEDTGAYVPELSARLEVDRNLTDGARRLGRKLSEVIYRQNREGRFTEITVSYLSAALHRSRRTIQRYPAAART